MSHPRECDASIARVGIKIFEVKRRKKEELCKFENLKLREPLGDPSARVFEVFLKVSQRSLAARSLYFSLSLSQFKQ